MFYTAWGHDQRTWGNPGFQNLVERGIRWAVGDDPGVVPAFAAAAASASCRTAIDPTTSPEMTAKRTDVKPFEYVEAKVPIYPPGRARQRRRRAANKMQQPLTGRRVAQALRHARRLRGEAVRRPSRSSTASRSS